MSRTTNKEKVMAEDNLNRLTTVSSCVVPDKELYFGDAVEEAQTSPISEIGGLIYALESAFLKLEIEYSGAASGYWFDVYKTIYSIVAVENSLADIKRFLDRNKKAFDDLPDRVSNDG